MGGAGIGKNTVARSGRTVAPSLGKSTADTDRVPFTAASAFAVAGGNDDADFIGVDSVRLLRSDAGIHIPAVRLPMIRAAMGDFGHHVKVCMVCVPNPGDYVSPISWLQNGGWSSSTVPKNADLFLCRLCFRMVIGNASGRKPL